MVGRHRFTHSLINTNVCSLQERGFQLQLLVVQVVCGCILSSAPFNWEADFFFFPHLWCQAYTCLLLCVPVRKERKDKKQGYFKRVLYKHKPLGVVCQAGIQGS